MYIGQTERGEIFSSNDKEIFKIYFEINKNKIKLTDNWEENKEMYRKLFEERVSIIIP